MSSPFHSAVCLLAFSVCGLAGSRSLRVCADPNNLPFSNQRQEGFENRLAEMAARDLGAKVEYTWWAERKPFLKNSLEAGLCDVVMGVPTTLDSVAVTRPYYRSTYVLVSRSPGIASLDDPRLDKLKIGIHIAGDDYTPPAAALARRGLAPNLVGYSLFGENGVANPPARLVSAVARGEVDIAIVWGPFAGYFARREKVRLYIEPVKPAMYLAVPFTYDISMAVRKGDAALRTELDRVLGRECGAIRKLLSEYAVPLVEPAEGPVEGKAACESSP